MGIRHRCKVLTSVSTKTEKRLTSCFNWGIIKKVQIAKISKFNDLDGKSEIFNGSIDM